MKRVEQCRSVGPDLDCMLRLLRSFEYSGVHSLKMNHKDD